ncbi:protein lin-9 homolog [Scaptodrosophila lebanonensis]|uniref:Protein lin-9 homolog n=1 Tax=Drosophila lebanonensis TaxID=7225 RepID=A0A6J2TCF6_DROLE|nr:protein lin-9 homolog [Scaptodrosophila lebanonensis]XP_030373070.1 protein lin-9 homolog [Scaptodrosophila lebanonensis]
MLNGLSIKLTNATEITKQTTEYDSADTVPPHLIQLGLGTLKKMSDLNEAQRLFKPQSSKDDKGKDEELFVKRPAFNRRQRMKKTISSEQEVKDLKELDQQEEESLSRKSAGKPATDVKKTGRAVVKMSRRQMMSYSMPGARQLYNFLKQFASHRWVAFEFLDSYIDGPIFAAQYDTERFMRECCPQVETRMLPRRAWQLVRRHMGKARRFSVAFIAQERLELARTRRILRFLQQRNFEEFQDTALLEHLPKMIPLPLAKDARVTSYVAMATVGICDGRVMSYDQNDSSYLVKLHICGNPTVVNMPDYRLQAVDECKVLMLSNIVQVVNGQPDESGILEREQGSEDQNSQSTEGDYSRELLGAVVQLRNLVDVKQKTVLAIAKMNESYEANWKPTRREPKKTPQNDKLQRVFATNMLTLHRINGEILEPLNVVQNFFNEYEKKPADSKHLVGNALYKKCRSLADHDLKSLKNDLRVKSPNTLLLLLNLQILLYFCAELGFENNDEVETMINDFIADMLKHMPAKLASLFKEIVQPVLQPFRQRIMCKTNRAQSKQQQVPQQLNLPTLNNGCQLQQQLPQQYTGAMAVEGCLLQPPPPPQPTPPPPPQQHLEQPQQQFDVPMITEQEEVVLYSPNFVV